MLPAPFGNDDWQLYDLSKDPAELNDLSKEQPTLRKEMIEFGINIQKTLVSYCPPAELCV